MEDKLGLIFEKIFSPYSDELSEEELTFVSSCINDHPLARLILIIERFKVSTIEYKNPLNGAGPGDVLDDIQKKTFIDLEKLGEELPLAFKVAGDLYLGTLGKIYFHSDLALPYFKKYAELSGDTYIVDNYEKYTHQKWEDYKDIQSSQVRKKYLKGEITYSHDPLYYEKLLEDK